MLGCVVTILLFGGPCVAEQQQSRPHAAEHVSTDGVKQEPPTHVIIDPPYPPDAHQQKPAEQSSEPQEKPLPRFARPEWVIVYVTVAYSLITLLMWFTIRRQASTMDRQATDARKASADASKVAEDTLIEMRLERKQTVLAMNRQAYQMEQQAAAASNTARAARKSAEAAFQHIQMLIDSQRARLEIRALGLTPEHEDEEFWNLRTGIEIRNVGVGRAYVRQAVGNFVVAAKDGDDLPTDPDYWNPLDVVNGFIDPTGDPCIESFYFFPDEKFDLTEFSQKICDGSRRLRLAGFIEYETVGARFRREFNYEWLGNEDPRNIGARLMFSENFKPRNNSERISFGYWAKHLLVSDGENEECEIEITNQPKRPAS